MSDTDELIRMAFQETCDGVPAPDPNGQFDMTRFNFPSNMFNAQPLPDISTFGLAGADLVPPEGTQEEADLMQMLEENGISIGLPARVPYMDHNYDQGLSLIFPSGTTSAMTRSATDGNGYATQSAVDPEWFSRNYSRPAPQPLPLTLTSSESFAIANETIPPPPIARRKRPAEADSAAWRTAKRGRWDGISTMEEIPPSAQTQTQSSRLLRAYESTEGNALKLDNVTTRTFGGEENFLATLSVPVAVSSSAQGLWPTMPSSAISETQTPFMAAGYSGQPFSLPIGAQPTVQQPAPMLPWDTIPETHQLFGSMPYMPTEYGFDFAQPPFTTAEQSPHEELLPWLPSAEMEDLFLLRSMPCMPIENNLDASFAPIAAQPSDQAKLTPQPSRYPLRSQQPRRECHMNPAGPQPFPFPVAAPTFDTGPYQTDDHLSSAGITSGTSGSSSSSTVPSTSKPKRRKQPPRACASSSSTAPSTAKAKNQKQPPRASGSKTPSTAKPKKNIPPRILGASSSSSTAPSTAKAKKRKPPQTPYDPNGIGCHICKGGFTKQSEVTKHLKTNKHRLNVFALLYPELELCASQLKKNFTCPECGKGMVRAWVVVRHLELKHGTTAKKASVKTVDDAGVQTADDVDVERVDESDAGTGDDADADDDESD